VGGAVIEEVSRGEARRMKQWLEEFAAGHGYRFTVRIKG
jgi:hypothetical protein